MYRKSVASNREKAASSANPFALLSSRLGLSLWFSILPSLILLGLSWVVYAFTADSYYLEPWMMPLLLGLATFAGGVVIRQQIEGVQGRMGLFCLGILALCAFAALTWFDIEHSGGIYSRLMPRTLKASLEDYLWFVPLAGLLGMVFYQHFSLRD